MLASPLHPTAHMPFTTPLPDRPLLHLARLFARIADCRRPEPDLTWPIDQAISNYRYAIALDDRDLATVSLVDLGRALFRLAPLAPPHTALMEDLAATCMLAGLDLPAPRARLHREITNPKLCLPRKARRLF